MFNKRARCDYASFIYVHTHTPTHPTHTHTPTHPHMYGNPPNFIDKINRRDWGSSGTVSEAFMFPSCYIGHINRVEENGETYSHLHRRRKAGHNVEKHRLQDSCVGQADLERHVRSRTPLAISQVSQYIYQSLLFYLGRKIGVIDEKAFNMSNDIHIWNILQGNLTCLFLFLFFFVLFCFVFFVFVFVLFCLFVFCFVVVVVVVLFVCLFVFVFVFCFVLFCFVFGRLIRSGDPRRFNSHQLAISNEISLGKNRSNLR